jgi:membrane protein
MLARWGFAVYIERFVLRGNLYGVLGVVPLFMLWLNLSWSIFLYGAQLAHTAANLRQFQQKVRAERQSLGPSDWLGVILAIARPYARGRGPARLDQIAQETDLPNESVRQLLDRFVASNLVCITDDLPEPGYLVARPLAQVDLTEILDLADPYRHPEGRADGPVRASVASALDRARAALHQDTLEDLVRLDHEARDQKDKTDA